MEEFLGVEWRGAYSRFEKIIANAGLSHHLLKVVSGEIYGINKECFVLTIAVTSKRLRCFLLLAY